MKNIGILGKLMTFLCITLFSSFILIYLFFCVSFDDYTEFVLKNSEKLLMEKYKLSLKNNTEVAVSMLSAVNRIEGLTKKQKLNLGRKLIRPLRFGKEGYYFVYETGTGINLMHGSKRQLEGKNLWNLQDPEKTQFIIRELDTVAKQKKIFHEYQWSKLGSDKLFHKLGTAMLVPGTNMWVGTGTYIDDINACKSELCSTIGLITQKTKRNIIIGFIILTLIAIAVIVLIAKNLTRPIKRLIMSTEEISEGNYNVQIKTKTRDEIGQLARTFNDMAKTLKDLTENLELKVEIRTAELQETMGKLNETNSILEGLSNKLSRYLSPQIRDMIFSGKQDVTINSSRKKLTVFFSDIKNFTQTTERLETEVLTELLNHYLDEMSTIAMKHGATIDKFIGDAILVFFGDPESRGFNNDAMAAVTMAIEMRSRLRELQKEWLEKGISEPFHVRMGINTGYCTVGNFGSNDRMEYTIIGSQVNLASRLESAAESDQILLSHETYALVKDSIYCNEMDIITAKGISYPIKTYQVIDYYDNLKEENKYIEESLEGFSFSMDIKKITPVMRKNITGILEDAITKLGDTNSIQSDEITKPDYNAVLIRKLINNIEKKIHVISEEKNISIKINTEDAPEIIKTDESLLIQIINDFLLNAVMLSQNETIVKLDISEDRGNLKIEITDNGKAIPKQKIKEVFMPHEKSTWDYPGLNLYNVKKSIRLLNGKIIVKNVKGKGNCFSTVFPLQAI